MRILLSVYLAVFFLSALLSFILDRINIRHLMSHGHEAPDVFKGEIDEVTLLRMRDYTLARSRIGSFEDLLQSVLALFILLSGFISWFAGKILALEMGYIVSGIFFFFGIALFLGVFEIPFELHRNFVIERRYGFSTITFGLWFSDFIKTTIISAILFSIILSALLGLISAAPDTWWLWMWGFYFLFQLLMNILYPVLIAPLFNKFEPLSDPSLKEGIIALMEKAHLKAKGIYKVDAIKRSRHSNAYFTGLSRTKRIVLFDTLLSSHARDEILAVLAHEIGHWKKGHILKQFVFSTVLSLFLLYLAYLLMNWTPLYSTFGVTVQAPYVGLLLLGLVAKPFAFFLVPLRSGISRAFEKQADDYGYELLGGPQPLVRALKRLAKENLSNLHPHPVFAWVYYHHPPLTERIQRLILEK